MRRPARAGRAARLGAWAAAAALAAGVPAGAPAHTLGEEADARCREAGVDASACALVRAAEEGLQRPGVSFGDFRDDGTADIEVADFYFGPRLAVVRDGQTVRFTNAVPPGGNRHSVSSADWGGPSPVLPAPLLGFGGGEAFRSGRLEPGDTFFLPVDVATMDPRGYVPLPSGDVLISYFCYIHGASQMSGQLLVRR